MMGLRREGIKQDFNLTISYINPNDIYRIFLFFFLI
jgi:hypothetical protein